MADPLSIASAIVGLLTAAGKSVAATLQTVGEMNMALSSVQTLMEHIDNLPAFQRSLIQVDHLSIVVTDAVITISKLESLVCQRDGFRYRLRWAWKERKVLSLLPRLESQKATLMLMVSVLMSTSNVEALNSSEKMREKMEEILEQNRTLYQHLHSMENEMPPDSRSVKFIDDAASVMSGRGSLRSFTSVATAIVRPHSIAFSARTRPSMRDFEAALQSSRVYKRSKSNKSDVSFTTSTAPTNAWTTLSGISLADISIISTYCLPITLNNIHTIAPGSTFSAMFMNSAEIVTESTPRRNGTPYMWNSRLTAAWNRHPLQYLRHHFEDMSADVMATRELGSSAHLPKIRVIVLGDSNALKSKMIHTFIQDSTAAGHDHVFEGSDCFQSSVREDPAFESVRGGWIPEICSDFTNIPYLVVGTQEESQQEVRGGDAKEQFAHSSIHGRLVAKQMGAKRYVDCEVGDVASVGGLIGQAIREAIISRSLLV
ncbi:hypothetical protein CcaCcLH18_08281 [Colletotrichum camelliae]|nr:hypothetical protein CcaCcLH18_08281 [Colletotrichum camelliae]